MEIRKLKERNKILESENSYLRRKVRCCKRELFVMRKYDE